MPDPHANPGNCVRVGSSSNVPCAKKHAFREALGCYRLAECPADWRYTAAMPETKPEKDRKGALGFFRRDRRRSSLLKMWLPAVVVTLLGFGVAFFFVEPSPPDTVVFVTGGTDGAYYGFAKEYAAELENQGVEVVIKESAGSVENLQVLQDEQEHAVIAFVQGGTANADATETLTSLGSVYLEPMWVFYRTDIADAPLDELAPLDGRRVAIGPKGSGTRRLARRVLDTAGVSPDTSDAGGADAAGQLKSGDLDAAFFVVGPEAGYIAGLLDDPAIEVLDLRRASGFSRLLPYLKTVLLHEGVIDPRRNLPDRDVRLVAPAATLVVNEDMHPALVPLFLEAAGKIHGGGGKLTSPGEFPSPNYVEVPLNEEARRYYKHGPPFLMRFLPFWAASLVDRLKVMLLPLLTLMFPLVRVAPPVIRWRIRNKIYRWYTALRTVDERMQEGLSVREVDEFIQKLKAIESELADVEVPLSYMEEFYNLRLHLDFVTRKLRDLREEAKIRENVTGIIRKDD